jgi:hypothetical protein
VPDAKQYQDQSGRSPYAQWFDDLPAQAAAKVTTGIARTEQGNFSNVKPVGSSVSEYTLDFGLVTGSILARTEIRSSSFWEAERKSGNRRTSSWRSEDGKTTNEERN